MLSRVFETKKISCDTETTEKVVISCSLSPESDLFDNVEVTYNSLCRFLDFYFYTPNTHRPNKNKSPDMF